MHQVLDWALAIGAMLVLARFLRHARSADRQAFGRKPGARKDGWLASRRRVREIREKGIQDRLRDQARHERQMERDAARAERERERDHAWREQGGGDGGPPRRGVRNVIRLRPEKPDSADDRPPQAPGGGTRREPPRTPPGTEPPPGSRTPPPGGPPGGGPPPPPRTGPSAPQAPPRPSPPPSGPAPQTAPAPAPARAPQPPTREGTAVSSPAVYTGVEETIGAIRRLGMVAAMGDIHDKRAAHAAYSQMFREAATAMQSLSRAMQDGQHYGPEMTEPAARAAQLAMAAGSAMADGESAITVFLNLKVGELRDSGRQVPHHDQLSGTPS